MKVKEKIIDFIKNKGKTTYSEIKEWAIKEKINLQKLCDVLDSLKYKDMIDMNWTDLGCIITFKEN